jgi:hypothetical protein
MRRIVALAVALLLVTGGGAMLWWSFDASRPVGTGPAQGADQAVPVRNALLDVADLEAVWPGPWVVLRTGGPDAFERPLVGCARAVSPLPAPADVRVRWAIHAPPRSDGPALTQVVGAAGDAAAAADAVRRVRGWLDHCPPARPGESGARAAVVLREMAAVDGFLAWVRWASEQSESSELVAVGRSGALVVVLSYGEYGPRGLATRAPDPTPLLEAFDRVVDRAERAGLTVVRPR